MSRDKFKYLASLARCATIIAHADLADSIAGEAAPAIRGIGSERAKVDFRSVVETNIS